ncbi:hypothetical protein [Chromobacterium alticapitis]|uniref:Uncharacterized protein n=1 Tax=Chromobacterium alticapitis TaxID=2073169 RepID=A0A2S5DB94_9NEIS|nr:hypothetical protein [Chromobacterium alticapitis]POZ60262.1 hypothetical protein C2I19_19835 [Chromobacterium alticapitis]
MEIYQRQYNYLDLLGGDVLPVWSKYLMRTIGFFEGPEGTIMVQLFPDSDIHVEMMHDAARHLVQLLEHYNWTQSDPRLRSDRWRRFWRGITTIERTIVVMYVQSNNSGKFQGMVKLDDLPQSLRFLGGHRRSRATDAVLHEFSNLRQIFVRACVNAGHLADHRKEAICDRVYSEERVDLAEIAERYPENSTARERLIQARLGQGVYRNNLLSLWGSAEALGFTPIVAFIFCGIFITRGGCPNFCVNGVGFTPEECALQTGW